VSEPASQRARLALTSAESEPGPPPAFEQLYEEHFSFVWRNLRRLGVLEANLGDAAQDVFLVVHRRLPEFELRGALRSWVYSIVVRVARQHRRLARRKPAHESPPEQEWSDPNQIGPEQNAAERQGLAQLIVLLGQLDDDKREAFVLAELEGLSAPEISAILGANVNTVYARIRAARKWLEAALKARGSQP
jgi:RNA polymerase sigma-70 factor (ECF subfamily)